MNLAALLVWSNSTNLIRPAAPGSPGGRDFHRPTSQSAHPQHRVLLISSTVLPRSTSGGAHTSTTVPHPCPGRPLLDSVACGDLWDPLCSFSGCSGSAFANQTFSFASCCLVHCGSLPASPFSPFLISPQFALDHLTRYGGLFSSSLSLSLSFLHRVPASVLPEKEGSHQVASRQFEQQDSTVYTLLGAIPVFAVPPLAFFEAYRHFNNIAFSEHPHLVGRQRQLFGLRAPALYDPASPFQSSSERVGNPRDITVGRHG